MSAMSFLISSRCYVLQKIGQMLCVAKHTAPFGQMHGAHPNSLLLPVCIEKGSHLDSDQKGVCPIQYNMCMFKKMWLAKNVA